MAFFFVMKGKIKMKKIRKRWISGVMAMVMLFSNMLPTVPLTGWADDGHKPGDDILNGVENMIGYCIDSFELLGEAGGIMGGVNEKYTYVLPTTKLSDEECAILFWATLSLLADKGNQECANARKLINEKAPTMGLPKIYNTVTESDLKKLIHSQAVRNKYPWLSAVVANQDKYMELAGLKGSGGGTSMGGKEIPAVLQNRKDQSTALAIDKNTFTIQFDTSGADREFIQKVPIKFSLTGGVPWSETPIGGWTYQKTDTAIIFSNPNPQPSKMMIQFDPTGTEFQKGGGYSSPEEMYDATMELWVCTQCSGLHVQHSASVMPLECHQRLINLNLESPVEQYYAILAGDPVTTVGGGDITFQIYRHEEEMTSTYNLQFYKYGHETGKPLENSTFKLYERFDDKGEIDREKDGPVHIYEGGEPYKSYHKHSPVVWDDFKFVSGMVTDENGYSAKTVNHGYHYDKTFCDGHPAPQFVSVPEEEEDEETGEITNEDEIEAAQTENRKLAQSWLDCYEACEAHASGDFSGVHFHWLMPQVDMGEIESVCSSGGSAGETPDAGKKISASADESYQESGCQADCRETYEKFISLRYSYALAESAARPGYILHDVHNDDLPIEVITTDASENGANAEFSQEYSKDIVVNNDVSVKGAEDILEQRRSIESLRFQEMLAIAEKQEAARELLKKEIPQYAQDPLRYLVRLELPKGQEAYDETEMPDEIDLIDDISGNGNIPAATPSNSSLATSSDAFLATASNAMYAAQVQFTRAYEGDSFDFGWMEHGREIDLYAEDKAGQSALFTDTYNSALNDVSSGKPTEPGPDDDYSHCNDADGEGDAWRIYDHRTEGELHINKRDMELEAGESDAYSSYGDTQGDGTLEGAVYGLFAATDIIHPDGKTGVVYRANNLVAVAATDKNGDASFMSNTEAPGHFYDYESGMIAETADGWAASAPKNLYTENRSYDDYTEDGRYERTYPDYETVNGNCWIGRPLFMGSYYVKELTRSEGYELSIGNRDNTLTNNGQDYDMALPTGTGYANISRRLYAEGQIALNPTGEYGDPDINELFFQAESRGTGATGFDIVLDHLPEGAKIYRLDTGKETQEVEVGTGVYEKVYLTNEDGSPKYVIAENDYQYPKYNADGSLMVEEISLNYEAQMFPAMKEQMLDVDKTKAAIESAEPAMDQAAVAAKLAEDFSADALNFLKGKVERALRASKKNTPKLYVDGKTDYSSIYVGIYDAGVREGEKDIYGVSGVTPGEPAVKTVYGSPVLTLEIPKTDGAGVPLKTGDMILSVLDFYNTNAHYNFGGIHSLEETADSYLVTVYAGCIGNPANYIVLGSDLVDDSVIYHRVSYLPDETAESPRYLYAAYSNNSDQDVFGTYKDYEERIVGGMYFGSATLITDAVAEGDGTLVSRTTGRNVYYLTGETPLDAAGNPIQAFEYREQTVKSTQEVEMSRWTKLSAKETGGKLVVHMDSSYTDRYGTSHNDTELQTYQMRVVLPEREIILTQEDLDLMYAPGDWAAGAVMGSSAYYLNVQHARVQAYLNYRDLSAMGDSSFVKQAELVYPGQQFILQDGANTPETNTRSVPIGVQERSLKQQMKVTKTIDEKSCHNTNSYTAVHEDWWTKLFGGGQGTAPAKKMDNFRFKAYLKSNLERLFRGEDGSIIWQDRKGNEIDILAANEAYPALAGKIFTKVLHATDPLKQDSMDAVIANQELYSYADGLINENQNSGYTAVLETVERLVEDGTGTRMVKAYNYDKFTDALAVANTDKWDDAAPTYTSWRPIGNAANRTDNSTETARVSDMVRQFAIDWYLDDEVEKLVREVASAPEETEDQDGSVSYTDEVYDEALMHAVKKAENYLKPFFAYDLDEIYAIAWDLEPAGGNDRDTSTLSLDTNFGTAEDSGDGYYYGLSAYLPYGAYIVAEQQPHCRKLEDFKNKHYQIDRPKEVVLPSVYESYDGSQASPEVLNGYYNYDTKMGQAEMERRYRIRFNEENQVIQAHNNSGDYEIYKYGQNIDRITNGVPAAPGTGDYFALTQSEYKPYKNYYNDMDDRTGGEVSYYLTEGQSGRNGVAESYRYSSVSEQSGVADDVPYLGGPVTEDNVPGVEYRDQVSAMHGIQTAFDGKYASMLVPYSVVPPADAEAEKTETTPEADGESSYTGYGYTKFRNRFYTAKLRIEKLDSETHENLLHDGALFNIYAAKRDDRKDSEGSVLFYTEPTTITGSKEFLEAMGAADIRPAKRRGSFIDLITGKKQGPGDLYTGLVPEGTPICEESEQIVLGDRFGKQTVAFKTYSTVRDGRMKEAASAQNGSSQKQPAQNGASRKQSDQKLTGQKQSDQNHSDQNHSGQTPVSSNHAVQTLAYQYQTVGYLETPQPLGAGCYVICEMKAPAGYVRSRPIALEVYSDKVTYYKEGNKDSRVLAALYEYEADNLTANGNKPQDLVNMARVHVENAPIRLKVEKVKEASAGSANTTADKTVTYKVSGRIDGKLADIGNHPDYVYAYQNGDYLGYAWKKGTLEYLLGRKNAGEKVELVYDGNLFAGYGYVTRTLETADDENQYVAGAVMTLFDALELKKSGDTEDHAYEGLVIERSNTNNVSRMYIKEGYAGEKVDFVREKGEDGGEIITRYQTGVDQYGDPVYADGFVWSAMTLKRHDTDILYYDLDSLDVMVTEWVDGRNILYGYDRNHRKVPVEQIESDKDNINRTDTEHSLFAFRGGVPYLEFAGGDFTRISYNRKDKIITVGQGTNVYHLDRDGNRDALVDPYTGMAYVTENFTDSSGNPAEKILVWAVNIRRDEFGNIIARDKITTSRIATIGESMSEDQVESGYITGSWQEDDSKLPSHHKSSLNQNQFGQNLNGEVLTDENNGEFDKKLNPVYDEHGLAVYYQNSGAVYEKGTDLYDRNGDFVRHQDSDNLEEYNQAAYCIENYDELYDGLEDKENPDRRKLYHRLGECYILENTWTASDATPNDPFKNQMTAGQPDILKRVPAGTYIMEELKAPDGYQKGMPVGISLLETKRLQRVKMIDHTTKIEIAKVDGTNSQQHRILDITARAADGESVPERSMPERSMPGENLPDRSMPDRSIPERSMPEESGTYGHGCVPGAELALFEAERVYTSDTNQYPKEYYLKKTGTKPFVYRSTDSRTGSIRELTARWITGEVPIYAEGIPEGCYLLEEQTTPAGFVTSEPVEVEITNTPEVQSFVMYDDHTRIEVEKYTVEGAEQKLVNGAGFTLYPAVLDTAGKVVYSDGKPLYDRNRQIDTWISRDAEYYRNFIPAFEAMYREYGCQPGTRVSWETEGKNRSATFLSAEPSELGKKHPVSAVLLFITDEGEQIRIKVFGEQQKRFGKDFMYEYQFDYRKLDAVNAYAASWLTLEGRRRIDYLPAGSKYVLVETTVPAGYAKAADMVIEVLDTADVQRYRIENQEGRILISKAAERPDGNFTGELSRAHLGLYRAAADGSFLKDKDHLVTDWITGNDGRYTKEDKINNRIPEGYQAGDLRLHEIGRLDSGVYWLAEMASPDYYTMMEPLKFEYDQEQEIRIIRAVNVPVTGSLTVKKTDEGGAMLSGVSYELSAFHPSNLRNPVFKRQFGDLTGVVTVSGLPVGEQTDDGTIVPYTYKLRELTPPDGYAASTEVFRWKFSPNHADQNHVSYEFGEQAQQEIVVTNQKTRITISKKDFDQFGSGSGEDDIGGNPAADGGFIEGAELAVYEVTGRDGFDHLIYDENHPFAAWTTESGEQEHAMEGLIAGHSYLLKELKAPTGYQLMRPILFMISSDGRKIAEISDLMNTITVHSFGGVERDVEPEVDVNLNTDHCDADSIQSVTVRGRYAVKTAYEMTDQNGNHVAAWIGAGEEYVIDSHTAKNLGLTEGEICAITEKTCYSDGTETVTGHRTQTLHFDKEGFFRIPVRTVSDVTLSMEHSDGTLIRSFKPSELAPEINIQNNVSPENPKITMRNCDGVAGDVLDSRKAVFVTVSYMNSGHTASDIELMVDPGAGVTILEPGNGSMIGDRLVFHLDQVGTLVSGMVMFTADVSGTEGKEAAITVTMKQNGSTVVMTKEVPVLQPSRLTVFHELTGSGKKLYSDEESEILIHLYRENGEELKGTYAYSGSRTGMMKSGDTIALAGNEFITIDPGHYRNIRYRAERKADGKEYSSRYTEGTAGETAGAGVVFTRYVADTAERETFRRGEEYVLQEETAYSNGEVIESNKLGIRLDDRASISQIIATDRKTRVLVSKTGIAGREELPGNEMCIRNLDGEVLVSWVSGREPYEIEGILEAGKTYILEEICPRKGYSYAEKIRFTIDTEGVVNQVMMQNDMTRIFVRKQDAETGEALAGAVFQIWDLEGNVLDTWISGESDNDSSGGFEMNSNNHGEFHEVTGILTAGETCILHEEQAPEGYEAGEDLEFTVPEGRETLTLTMENRKKDKPEEPDKPKEPEKPEEPDKPQEPDKPEEPDKPQEPEKPDRPELPQKPKKIGTVSAVYHPETIGEGIIVEESGKDWRRFLPYLGDRSEMTLLSVLFGMAVLGIAVCLLSERIRKRKQDTRKDRPYNP